MQQDILCCDFDQNFTNISFHETANIIKFLLIYLLQTHGAYHKTYRIIQENKSCWTHCGALQSTVGATVEATLKVEKH